MILMEPFRVRVRVRVRVRDPAADIEPDPDIHRCHLVPLLRPRDKPTLAFITTLALTLILKIAPDPDSYPWP